METGQDPSRDQPDPAAGGGRDSTAAGGDTSDTSVAAPLQRINGGLAVLVVIAVVGALYFARPFLLPVVAAVLLSFLIRPFVALLSGVGLPRWVGAVTSLLTVMSAIVISGVFLLPMAAGTMESLPQTVDTLRERLRGLDEPLRKIQEALEQVQTFGQEEQAEDATDATGAADAADGQAPEPEPVPVRVQSNQLLTALAGNTGAAAVGLLLTAILAFFLVASDEQVLIRVGRLLPEMESSDAATHVLRRLESQVSRYLITLTLINLTVGTAMTLAAWAIGVPQPWIMGLIAGLFNYVPYLGPIVAVALIAVMSMVHFPELGRASLAPLAFGAINMLEAYVLSPLIYGERLRLNPVAIIIGLMFFSWTWGVAGAILAVPLLVCVKITCQHVPRWAALAEMLGPVGDNSKR